MAGREMEARLGLRGGVGIQRRLLGVLMQVPQASSWSWDPAQHQALGLCAPWARCTAGCQAHHINQPQQGPPVLTARRVPPAVEYMGNSKCAACAVSGTEELGAFSNPCAANSRHTTGTKCEALCKQQTPCCTSS